MTTDISKCNLDRLIFTALTDEPEPLDESEEPSDADEAMADDLDVAPEEAEA